MCCCQVRASAAAVIQTLLEGPPQHAFLAIAQVQAEARHVARYGCSMQPRVNASRAAQARRLAKPRLMRVTPTCPQCQPCFTVKDVLHALRMRRTPLMQHSTCRALSLCLHAVLRAPYPLPLTTVISLQGLHHAVCNPGPPGGSVARGAAAGAGG